jgi:hypothetical protein
MQPSKRRRQHAGLPALREWTSVILSAAGFLVWWAPVLKQAAAKPFDGISYRWENTLCLTAAHCSSSMIHRWHPDSTALWRTLLHSAHTRTYHRRTTLPPNSEALMLPLIARKPVHPPHDGAPSAAGRTKRRHRLDCSQGRRTCSMRIWAWLVSCPTAPWPRCGRGRQGPGKGAHSRWPPTNSFR